MRSDLRCHRCSFKGSIHVRACPAAAADLLLCRASFSRLPLKDRLFWYGQSGHLCPELDEPRLTDFEKGSYEEWFEKEVEVSSPSF